MTVTAIDLLAQRVATAVASYATLERSRLKVLLTDLDGKANFTATQHGAWGQVLNLNPQSPEQDHEPPPRGNLCGRR